MKTSTRCIAFGAALMALLLFVPMQPSLGWVIAWLVSVAAIGFGIGARGDR